MPEIAEVEIVRRGLEPLLGGEITEVISNYEKLGINDHISDVLGLKLIDLCRQGKWLGLELEDTKVIAVHLRMTGHMAIDQPSEKDRIQFQFGAHLLSFTDSRGFGTVDLISADQFSAKTGPDLFDQDLTGLAEDPKTSKSKRAAKAVLLDQAFVGGIGNYLADESLWTTCIHPQSRWDLLSVEQRDKVIRAARGVAISALQRGGVSLRDYAAVDGTAGEMQTKLQCYGRAGSPCNRCGTILEKIRVAGRGTTYCPSCQIQL